ncbi:wax ester synthase-like acyl-CoA acyltransferase domain-containing protein [Mycena galericulata]|nr:wax ester synthase-like acyl-CoA acyltransferase domain-containing protein [Mycena galericulata]
MRDPMIPATIELAETLPLAKATALVSEHLLAIPRMSHRLVLPSVGVPYWEPCEKVDVSAHVHEYTLPLGSGYAELRALVERLSRALMDPARPPWDVAVIQRPEAGSVLFTRVHHAITDGRGVTNILIACSDEPRVPPPPQLSSSAPVPAPNLLARLAQTARNIKDLRNLDRPAEKLSAIKCAEPLEEVAMAWMQRSLGLADLKRLARRLGGGTVNDVVLAAVAGALRTYMRAHGDDVDKMAAIQCKLPVDVFSPSPAAYIQTQTTKAEADVVLGTHLGDLNVTLPTNVDAAEARFVQVRATMRKAKAGYRAGLAASMAGVVGGLATSTRLSLIATDAKTVSCYVSNMKGPSAAMHLAGVPVTNVRCHPLGLNNIGVGFAVYSYGGRVNVAVCTDRQLVGDPDVLCGYLEDELQQLLSAAAAARMRSLRADSVAFLPRSPQFTSVYSVELACPIEAAAAVLLPADSPAISRFLVGTRDASLKLAADYIHHGTDYVRFDVAAAFASSDALPLISTLEPVDKNDIDDGGSGCAAPILLQRDCFTVIERLPMLFGLIHQTVTVKSWQVLDPARRVSVYESVVEGAGVRVWKMRELVDLGGDSEKGTRRTRVDETLRGVCPWMLQGVVKRDSVASHT